MSLFFGDFWCETRLHRLFENGRATEAENTCVTQSENLFTQTYRPRCFLLDRCLSLRSSQHGHSVWMFRFSHTLHVLGLCCCMRRRRRTVAAQALYPAEGEREHVALDRIFSVPQHKLGLRRCFLRGKFLCAFRLYL
jgi:hypothetical protein